MTLVAVIERTDRIDRAGGREAQRVSLGVGVSLSGCEVARQHIDLGRDGVAPVADAGGGGTAVVAARVGGVHGRASGGRDGGVEPVLELQVFHAFDQRHDVEGARPEFRTLQRGNAVAGLVVVGDEIDVGAELVDEGGGDAVLLIEVEIAGIGVQRVVGPRVEFRGAPRGLQVDITGHLRVAAGRAHGAGARAPQHQDIGPGAQVRHASRSVGAVVVALYRERHGAVERRHVGRAGIGERCGDGELRVGRGDRAGVERSQVAGIAQVVAEDLQRIAAVLSLLVGAFDLSALTAVAGEQPDQRGENDQADGDGHHQLDDRVSPRACRTVESHDALSNTR